MAAAPGELLWNKGTRANTESLGTVMSETLLDVSVLMLSNTTPVSGQCMYAVDTCSQDSLDGQVLTCG